MGISLQDNADNGLYMCAYVGVKRIVVPKTSLQVYSNFETKLYHACSHACPSPGHPSAADEAWYWLKCVLHSGHGVIPVMVLVALLILAKGRRQRECGTVTKCLTILGSL